MTQQQTRLFVRWFVPNKQGRQRKKHGWVKTYVKSNKGFFFQDISNMLLFCRATCMMKIQVQIAGGREGDNGQECLRDNNDQSDHHQTDLLTVYTWSANAHLRPVWGWWLENQGQYYDVWTRLKYNYVFSLVLQAMRYIVLLTITHYSTHQLVALTHQDTLQNNC